MYTLDYKVTFAYIYKLFTLIHLISPKIFNKFVSTLVTLGKAFELTLQNATLLFGDGDETNLLHFDAEQITALQSSGLKQQKRELTSEPVATHTDQTNHSVSIFSFPN